ncbi:MAG: hypothetical protein PHC39_04650 [Proteiniphilum sp.]|nr:hypothetical protein [Proteiniphilum sp.]
MKTLNVLTGIIPAMPSYDEHEYPELFTFKTPVDHYSITKGSNDKKSPNYTPGCHQKKPAINIPVVGSLYKKETFPGISYTHIELTTKIQDGIIAEITPKLNVLLNGVLIAESPKLTTTKSGKEKARTQAERLRFCKAVVWALINDEMSLKDKLLEIGCIQPVNDSVKDFMIEEITMSPYPGPGIVDEIRYTEEYAYLTAQKDLSILLKNELADMAESEVWDRISLEVENNPESVEEIINAFCKIPGTYYPHLKVYIQEVPA